MACLVNIQVYVGESRNYTSGETIVLIVSVADVCNMLHSVHSLQEQGLFLLGSCWYLLG